LCGEARGAARTGLLGEGAAHLCKHLWRCSYRAVGRGVAWTAGRSWGRCSYRAVGRGQPGLLGEAGGAAHTGLLEGGMLLAPIKKAA